MSDWVASDELIDYILSCTKPGQTVLEFGSGESTRRFIDAGRKVVTVEQDPAWLHAVRGATYLYAPVKLYDATYQPLPSIRKKINTHTGWYDHLVLREALQHQHWDIILVDGPTRNVGRSGFLQHLDIFPSNSLDVPIVFDDLYRLDDLWVAERVAAKLGRDLLVTNHGETRVRQKSNGDWMATEKKPFGVVLMS